MTIFGAQSKSSPRFDDEARRYDALLRALLRRAGGRGRCYPFLENVTRGRNVPRERLVEVAEHYLHFGGVSPINAQNRALIAALEAELAAHGPKLPIYFGNRNWHPFVTDTDRARCATTASRARSSSSPRPSAPTPAAGSTART